MTQRGEKDRTALIRRLSGRASRALGKGKGAGAGPFVTGYFESVPPTDLFEADEDVLLGGALSLLAFAQKRKPGRPSIRVFNPDPERDGWTCSHSVIEIVNDDMPFLVDSITAELHRLHLTMHLIVHPVVKLRRAKAGALREICAPGDERADVQSESMMHIEINEQTLPERLEAIAQGLEAVLADVRAAVDDWRSMRVRVADVIASLDSSRPPLPAGEIQETSAFLRWIDDRNFTFLGYREYDFKEKGGRTTLHIKPGSGLGLLRKDSVEIFEGMRSGEVLPPDIADFLRKPTLLMMSKANNRSTVHRPVHLDTIGVKTFNKAGAVSGQRLFVGLFTSSVYSQGVHEIPLLRKKIDDVVRRSGFSPVSHDGKAMLHILESMPREDLFQYSEHDLYETATGILHLQDRQRVALFVRRDPFGRYVSCLIYLPRERYTTAIRQQMQEIVEDGFGGRVSVYYTQVSESELARLQFIVRTVPGQPFPQEIEEIEARLAEAGRDWRDDLMHALVRSFGEARGFDLFHVYAESFPGSYRERFSPDAAVHDIVKIEAVVDNRDLAVDLFPGHGGGSSVRFKLYHLDTPVHLSHVLPMLENMGLVVESELPNRIEPGNDGDVVWVQDFAMSTRTGAAVDVAAIEENFEEAFLRVWRGEMESDGFNRLVIGAGLSWRQIVVLRAYCRYLLQTQVPFSQSYMEDTLSRNAQIASTLVELFECRFDPAGGEAGAKRLPRLRKKLDQLLENVTNIDEDRILRRFINVVESTLRTNFYQTAEDGAPKSYLSFKINSAAIEELPLPHPFAEIFVYSTRMEGIHLRGGRVARGGIRWSDRREDFRTEILGLMKAQMTKNAVIVPVGAKGGFVVKNPPSDGARDAVQQEGIDCYKTLMRGLLDITDNLKPDGIVYPDNVVRCDGDDPYLVVAADKGTATFSDIANGIARDYGFWLDDAFASGGSAGYDHKKMGITARGAWESVKRHFREMGADTQSQDFTCVGIGDMSGDVFGNGMLLSPHIRLIAAFNHMHIFIDPAPDAASGFKERKRLFGLARSSWNDYDAKLISKGGGVFERSAKTIAITPEMRTILDLPKKDTATPTELLRSILRASVDLLWFGGIGTYVKARAESHADAGDRINDTLRVNADELRCKVVGEGANLGVTQRGRIDYALGGGRINTDFIDNSAGVSTSDHEVNIKILLGEVIAAKKLTAPQRDKLLVEMTDELAAHVLMDNYRQSMALTHVEAVSPRLLDEAARFMRGLERAGKLSRPVEFLPDDEQLEERRLARRGLTRPEWSVLLAYSKMTLYGALLDSDVPDDPYLAQDIGLYFPTQLRTKFPEFIPAHRLRREISATYVTNSLVNRAGPTFVSEISDKTGCTPPLIARAYLVIRQIYGLHALWASIESLDTKVHADVQSDLNLEIQKLLRHGTLWMLRNGPRPLDVQSSIKRFRAGIATLTPGLNEYVSEDLRVAAGDGAAAFVQRGVPDELAHTIAGLDLLYPACDIVNIAAGGGYDVREVARVYYGIGARFGLDWLRAAAEKLTTETEWQSLAVSGIVDELYDQQTVLTTKIVDESGGGAAAEAVIDAWVAANSHGVQRAAAVLAELKQSGALDLAMLAVANREIRALIES